MKLPLAVVQEFPTIFVFTGRIYPWEVWLLSPASQDLVKYKKNLHLCLVGYLANF